MGAVATSPLLLSTNRSNSVADQPNIVMIFVDDLHTELLPHMPSIQKLLVDGGLTFRKMTNVVPVCGPSRVAVFRSQYSGNNGAYSNEMSWDVYRNREYFRDDIGVWMKNAGYNTGYFGKYINQYDGRHVSFGGWERWYAWNGPKMGWTSLNNQGNVSEINKETADPRMAAAALKWVNERATEPFFMWNSFGAPHGGYFFDPEDAEMFPGLKVPRTEAFNEADVSDKPSHVRDNRRFTDDEIREMDKIFRQAAKSLYRVDKYLKELVETLTTKGILDNTYIFFYSDNGDHFGEHRLEHGKNAPYKTDIGNPLMVMGPGISPGSVSDKLVSSVDLAPTITTLAGGTLPDFIDGESFDELLFGNEINWTREIQRTEKVVGGGGIPAWKGARTVNDIYAIYENGEEEYYDYRIDPDEVNNSPQNAPQELKDFVQQY
jgi:N-acetylglucosamine-6-sulfatase